LNTKISASTVYNAQSYRFEITKGGVVTVYDSASYNFRLSDAGIVATNGSTYAIRVAAKVNGVLGNYGASCNVTMPGSSSSSRQIVENTDFSLVAYPNPSNSAFKLQVNGSNNENVSVLVFDMMGRQIENKVVNATDIENISLGQNYSTGVYNVIVSQGMNTKTVRLVKN
jgi:Secretion system C-terminal sorting domain